MELAADPMSIDEKMKYNILNISQVLSLNNNIAKK